MRGELIFLASFVLVLSLVGDAPADDFKWDNSSGDSLWRTGENWDLNKLPGASDALYVDWIADPTEIIIDAETDAECNSITLSNDAAGGQGYVHLHMTGGTFVAGNLIRVGRRELAMFTLDAGDVTCASFQLGRKDPSKGVVIINGGTITVATNTRVPRGGSEGSELHLNGGTLHTNGLVMNDPEDPLSGTNGSMDIAGGVMVLTSEEDQTEKIKGYVQNGWITAYGVKSGELLEDGRLALVQMDFDLTNPGMTTVWASASNPTQARAPVPEDGATVQLAHATAVEFLAGGRAAWHDVYFGSDEDAVTAADASDTTGIYRGRRDVTGYIVPEALEWGGTYYWRIDEIEADGTAHTGPVWSFTVADYFLVDDFESYSADKRIWENWLDGLGSGMPGEPDYLPGNGTGSGVGDETSASFTAETIVHSGSQSMPYWYDNNKPGYARYSEVGKTLIYPRDWTEQGVGELSLWFRGYPTYVGGFTEDPPGTYTINASGADIWDASDQFHFAYKQVSGAASIVARVSSVSHTDDWAKAGVMIRDSLDADSAHAIMAVTPASGVWFGRRAAAGQSSISTKQPDITAPQWVKLERSVGGLVRASYSDDGNTWTALGTPEAVTMDAPIYIGLALTSHNPDATCEAKFSDVSFPNTSVDAEWVDRDVGMLANAPEPMYVAIADGAGMPAVVYHDDPNAAVTDIWAQWVIPLRQFADQGVNLADVDRIAIGFGDRANLQAGGSGKMYFDDIRLYRSEEEPEPEKIVTVQWLGHSTVKIWTEDYVIYVDPERVPQSLHDATLVCVTHTHGDHYSPSDIAKVSNDQTIFIGPPDVVQRYGGGQTISPGQTIQLDGAGITAVPSYNTNKPNHPKSNNWVGYVVEIASKRIYVAGDTDLIDEMRELGDIDVAFLPAGGTYTMNAAEAAEATQYIKPGLAIPYHWGQSVGTLSDAQTFADLAKSAARVMTVNETISSDNWPEYSPLIALSTEEIQELVR
jgi:L-ascorbate metabolism protein UlaG (beta-lactamase superfamily)